MEITKSFAAVRGKAACAKVPLIEIVGQKRVLIENHLGVLAYSFEEIQVKVLYGKVIVIGQNLTIMQLCSEQLVITGKISAVQMSGR